MAGFVRHGPTNVDQFTTAQITGGGGGALSITDSEIAVTPSQVTTGDEANVIVTVRGFDGELINGAFDADTPLTFTSNNARATVAAATNNNDGTHTAVISTTAGAAFTATITALADGVQIGNAMLAGVMGGLGGVQYLMIAGGGGGGGDVGGGGGAGEYLDVSSANGVTFATGSYPVVIGEGGNGTAGIGNDGGDTSFNNITVNGGGGGGRALGVAGRPGGSGGGSGGHNGGGFGSGGASVLTGNGVGNAGGNHPAGVFGSGGGGGAGSAGSDGANSANAGTGGNGLTWIDGITRAGGGGGTGTDNVRGPGAAGGTGGGGNGGFTPGGRGANAAANTGSGGGGGGHFGGTSGGNGADGVVVIRYPVTGTAALAIGGDVTVAGGIATHTFNNSGTFTVPNPPTVTTTVRYDRTNRNRGAGLTDAQFTAITNVNIGQLRNLDSTIFWNGTALGNRLSVTAQWDYVANGQNHQALAIAISRNNGAWQRVVTTNELRLPDFTDRAITGTNVAVTPGENVRLAVLGQREIDESVIVVDNFNVTFT